MYKSYRELSRLKTFDERFNYLYLGTGVGVETFGSRRWMNQRFYTSKEWRNFRHKIIVRDNGCDLGIDGYQIPQGVTIIIHHINPISIEDIDFDYQCLMDENNCIATTLETHNAIHYGGENKITNSLTERTRNDTCPWRK